MEKHSLISRLLFWWKGAAAVFLVVPDSVIFPNFDKSKVGNALPGGHSFTLISQVTQPLVR